MIRNIVALKSDLNEMEDTIDVVSGVVLDNTFSTNEGARIIAVLIAPAISPSINNQLLSYKILSDSDRHFVFTKVKSNSILAAFKDLNGNYILDKGEPSVFQTASPRTSEHTLNRAKLNDNTLVLTSAAEDTSYVIDVTFETVKQAVGYMKNVGEITDFDNPNFSPSAIQLGLWEPLRFAKEIGFGFYLIEPWHSDKDILILVHGINDSPKSWQTLVKSIDLEQHQVLLFHYPSGFSLEASATVLANLVEELHQRTGNKEVDIIAHSMGGLVAKRFIQLHNKREIAHNIKRLITISTPWEGHVAAQLGVESAPVIVPVWRDLAPESQFLKSLRNEGLPRHIQHLLIYTFAGQKGNNEANDGVVSISSQLSINAQDQATLQYGFNQEHSEILYFEELFNRINIFLKN